MRILISLVLSAAVLSMSSVETASGRNLGETLSDLKDRIAQLEHQLRQSKMPTGIIVMWSGTVNDTPEGWALCDGTEGTPNLSSRFVMGTIVTDPNESRTGGGDVILADENLPLHHHSIQHGHEHTLQMAPASHTHGYRRTRTDVVGSPYEDNKLEQGGDRGLWTGDSVTTDAIELTIVGEVSDFSGNSASSGRQAPVPVEIVPSFYKLAFIMKVGE